ncbi:MAG: APC family permease [Steroidobacteraceae bacterium]
MSAAQERGRHGLRATCLSFPEVLSQSVANISPTLTPVIIVPLVFASAGEGTWLAYLIATVGLVLVGTNVNQFTRRSATPGSLYAFVTRGLGVTLGFVCGWCLILAYTMTGMAVMAGSVMYAALLLHQLHLPGPPPLLFAAGVAGVWLIAYKDVQLSTRVMLVLEGVSMLLILALCITVLARRGQWLDAAQFRLGGMSGAGLKTGLILAIFSFVGYESASTLGEEARNPLVNIPRSVLLSAIISGLFFMLCAYVAVLGFKALPDSLATSAAPFNELADGVGAGFFGMLISICAVISLFACTLAAVNAAARVLFSMGRHGMLHPQMGKAHDTNLTPHHAVSLSCVLVLLLPAALLLDGVGLLDILNDLSTLSTFGFLIAYVLVSVAAPFYLRRIGQLSPTSVLCAALSVAFMAPPLIAAVYPTPAAPADRFPLYFLLYLAAGLVWYTVLRTRTPATVVQQIHADLELDSAGLAGD